MITDATVTTVVARIGGRCEVCWVADGQQLHHRRPRGMGGSVRPDTNLPGNLLHVCQPCHAKIESERRWARMHGYVVAQHADPTRIPVRWQPSLWDDHAQVLLAHDGTVTGWSEHKAAR